MVTSASVLGGAITQSSASTTSKSRLAGATWSCGGTGTWYDENKI